MIQTIKPDERGRVSLLPDLKLIGWKHGDAVEIDFIKVVEIITTKREVESQSCR